MARIKFLWLVLSCCLAGGTLWAQTNTNTFKLTVKPSNNAIMVEGTTNVLAVTISNLAITNTVPDPTGGTNTTTNVTLIFTNVSVTASAPQLTLSLYDNGSAPDAAANDGIFSASFIPALVPDPLILSNLVMIYKVSGDDLTYTNSSGQQVLTNVTVNVTNTYRIVARPKNDNFTNAFKIVAQGALVLATNNYASLQAGEPPPGGNASADVSVWWEWSTPVGAYTLIDLGSTAFNSILSVYTGNSITGLVSVASATNDPVSGLKPWVNFDAQAGTTYRISVAGADSNSVGAIRLRLAPAVTFDTNGPSCAIASPRNGSLFTTNLVTFTGTAAESDPNQAGVAKVYLSVNNGTPVVINNNTPLSLTSNKVQGVWAPLAIPGTNAWAWSGQLTLPPGTNTVTAYAMDYDGNKGTNFTLSVTYMNPTNYLFASAIRLRGNSGGDLAINGRAIPEPGGPLIAGNEGGHPVWWSWQAPGDGVLSVTTSNSNFDTLLGVFTGTNVTNLTAIAGNDDAYPGVKWSQLSTYVYSNTLYYICVDGYGGASGFITLNYRFTPQSPPPFYTLTVNNSVGGTISPGTGYYPTNSTVVLTATPARNYIFGEWDGSVTSTSNPLTLLMTGDKTITARFLYINYTETFASGTFTRLPWTTPSGAPWTLQTNIVPNRSQWAARSGVIGDNQESTLQLVAHTLAGSGSFDLKVSSEGGFDFLQFYLNGALLKEWSGEIGWMTYYFDVPAGTNTFLWRYVKDPNFSAGLDAGFIGNINLPQGDLAPVLTLTSIANHVVSLQLQGKLDQSYLIQGSTDLQTWTTLSTNASPIGLIQITDPQAPNYPARFYRAVTP